MPETQTQPEERHEGATHPPAWRGWAIIAVMLLGYILWITLIYLLVGERDRGWLYATKPSVPGASAYSTETPANATVQRQIAPIPAPLPAPGPAAGASAASGPGAGGVK